MTMKLEQVNQPFTYACAANPLSLARSLWTHRDLFGSLLRDAISAKFRHSRFGALWLLIPQLSMLAIYVYVFSCIFHLKWPGEAGNTRLGFGLTIYLGISLYSVIADTAMGCCGVITGKANYVKRIPIPLELFPLSFAVTNFLVTALFLLVIAVGVAFATASARGLFLFLPILTPLLLLAVGGGLVTATLGVFFRDIGNLLGILLLILFFTAPVFYDMSAVPAEFRFIAYCNPLTPILVNARHAILFGLPVDRGFLLASWIWGLGVCQIGHFCFSYFKRRFADVL